MPGTALGTRDTGGKKDERSCSRAGGGTDGDAGKSVNLQGVVDAGKKADSPKGIMWVITTDVM